MRPKILKILLSVWVFIWGFLIIRELVIKDNLSDYIALAKKPLEGKRAHVAGDGLYRFIGFSKKNVPAVAKVSISGIEDGSLEKRRAAYYLYPVIEAPDPDYALVYGAATAAPEGYSEIASGEDGSVFKRKGAAR